MRYVIAPTSDFIAHSAKGSSWEQHKYIKRIDGTYYYPNSYEGGRHLPSNNNKDKEKEEPEEDSKYEITPDDVEALAKEVIKGNFGNGALRKELFGEYYQEIQNRVNEIMKSKMPSTSNAQSTKVSTKEDDKKDKNKKDYSNSRSVLLFR